jgi:hypothetical protein
VPAVLRQVHDGHPAPAELALDKVTVGKGFAENGTGVRGHCPLGYANAYVYAM